MIVTMPNTSRVWSLVHYWQRSTSAMCLCARKGPRLPPATLALPLRDPPGHGWIAVVRYKNSNKLTVGMCMEMRWSGSCLAGGCGRLDPWPKGELSWFGGLVGIEITTHRTWWCVDDRWWFLQWKEGLCGLGEQFGYIRPPMRMRPM
jgi:hypothetical protein